MARTTLANARCRKFPGSRRIVAFLFVLRPTVGGSNTDHVAVRLKTVNVGIGGWISAVTSIQLLHVCRALQQHFGHACIICTAGHVLVEIDRQGEGRADSLIITERQSLLGNP